MNLKVLLGKYDKCQLECDGLTRVLHTILTIVSQPHTVKVGAIKLGKAEMAPHFWIELPDGRIVDYRARMWLGSKAPHGIFKQSKVVYDGAPVDMEILDDYMFKLLTGDM